MLPPPLSTSPEIVSNRSDVTSIFPPELSRPRIFSAPVFPITMFPTDVPMALDTIKESKVTESPALKVRAPAVLAAESVSAPPVVRSMFAASIPARSRPSTSFSSRSPVTVPATLSKSLPSSSVASPVTSSTRAAAVFAAESVSAPPVVRSMFAASIPARSRPFRSTSVRFPPAVPATMLKSLAASPNVTAPPALKSSASDVIVPAVWLIAPDSTVRVMVSNAVMSSAKEISPAVAPAVTPISLPANSVSKLPPAFRLTLPVPLVPAKTVIRSSAWTAALMSTSPDAVSVTADGSMSPPIAMSPPWARRSTWPAVSILAVVLTSLAAVMSISPVPEVTAASTAASLPAPPANNVIVPEPSAVRPICAPTVSTVKFPLAVWISIKPSFAVVEPATVTTSASVIVTSPPATNSIESTSVSRLIPAVASAVSAPAVTCPAPLIAPPCAVRSTSPAPASTAMFNVNAPAAVRSIAPPLPSNPTPATVKSPRPSTIVIPAKAEPSTVAKALFALSSVTEPPASTIKSCTWTSAVCEIDPSANKVRSSTSALRSVALMAALI